MKIQINDLEYHLEKEGALSSVFSLMNMALIPGIALALNNKVIPRSAWDKEALKDGDKILLITATQGG